MKYNFTHAQFEVDYTPLAYMCSISGHEVSSEYAQAVSAMMKDVISYITPATYNYRGQGNNLDGDVYAYGEGICAPSLEQIQCTHCIQSIFQTLALTCGPKRTGGRYRVVDCYVRYENFRFEDTLLN